MHEREQAAGNRRRVCHVQAMPARLDDFKGAVRQGVPDEGADRRRDKIIRGTLKDEAGAGGFGQQRAAIRKKSRLRKDLGVARCGLPDWSA